MEFLCIYIIIGAFYSAYLDILITQNMETIEKNNEEFKSLFENKFIRIASLFLIGILWIIMIPLRIKSVMEVKENEQ